MVKNVFEKVMSNSAQNIRILATRAIKNNKNYSCQLADIKTVQEDNIVYPSSEQLESWIQSIFDKDLKSRVYSQQALDNMKKKGISPGKDPLDILLIIVTSSDTDVYLTISVPKTIELDVSKFISNLNKKNHNFDVERTELYHKVKFSVLFPFKEKDDLYQNIFIELEKLDFYHPEPDDDMCYTFDD